MHTYPILFAASILAVAGQVLFKLGSNPSGWRIIQSPTIWGGLACYLLGTALWIYALSGVRLGVAYAFTSLTFVGVYAACFFILKETVTPVKIVGLLLILSGFLVLAKWG